MRLKTNCARKKILTRKKPMPLPPPFKLNGRLLSWHRFHSVQTDFEYPNTWRAKLDRASCIQEGESHELY